MNRTALNSAVLGSVGSTPFITGVLRATITLVGKVTSSVQHFGAGRGAMLVGAVGKFGISVYGYASAKLTLVESLVGTRNSLKYIPISEPLRLDGSARFVINHLKYTPISQPMVLVGYESGQDFTTDESVRVVLVPAQNRTVVVPAASNGSGV
jgi:hypothetical protein